MLNQPLSNDILLRGDRIATTSIAAMTAALAILSELASVLAVELDCKKNRKRDPNPCKQQHEILKCALKSPDGNGQTWPFPEVA